MRLAAVAAAAVAVYDARTWTASRPHRRTSVVPSRALRTNMMTTQQQSADQLKSYAYPLGPPSVDIPHAAASVAPCKSEPTAVLSDARAGATSCSSTDSSSTTALPDRKRKEPASPSDQFDADGRAEAVDKQQQQQPSKKSRRELPPHTVAILKGWMLSREHVKHPYPTDEVLQAESSWLWCVDVMETWSLILT